MAKPEWGHKRTCQSCGCRFYDLKHSPIICPKCGTTVEPDVPFKVRRAGGVPIESKAAVPAIAAADITETDSDDLVESVADEDVVDDDETAEEDDASLIEDASDLGEDDDDMAEVMEHMDGGLEDEV